MDKQLLKKEWLKDEQITFSGWDFSAIDASWENEALPWSYPQLIKQHLTKEMVMLDMGTGGGEFLLTLDHPHAQTAVTEGWEPNIELLQQKLVPLGIKLAPVADDDLILYEDNQFDIILNRHESFSVAEVKRVLKPNGIFITQQVGESNGDRLAQMIIGDVKSSFAAWNLTNTLAHLKASSFEIRQADEYYPCQKFFTMKALIYYVKVIEWEYPNFNVGDHFDGLQSAYEELLKAGFVLNYQHRFLVVARNLKE